MNIDIDGFEKTDPYGALFFAIGSEDDFFCFDYGIRDDMREIKLHAVINSETGSFIQDAEPPTIARLANAVEEAQRLTDQAIGWLFGEGIDDPVEHDTEGWNQDPQFFVRCVAECVASIQEKRTARSDIPRIVEVKS